MGKYTPKQYAEVLYDLVGNAPSAGTKNPIKNFIAAVVKNGDMSKTNLIISEFEKICLFEKGEKKIEVTTIGGKESFPAGQLKGEVIFRDDEKVLGGVRIRIDDKLIDNTLRARVSRLKESLEV